MAFRLVERLVRTVPDVAKDELEAGAIPPVHTHGDAYETCEAAEAVRDAITPSARRKNCRIEIVEE